MIGGKNEINNNLNHNFKIKINKKKSNYNINKFNIENYKYLYDDFFFNDVYINIIEKLNIRRNIKLKKNIIYNSILMIIFFIVIKFININKFNSILLSSKNYRIIEYIYYYIDNPNIDHLYFDYEKEDINNNSYNKILLSTQQIKKKYKFNDYYINVFTSNKKYDFLFLDFIKKRTKQMKVNYDDFIIEYKKNTEINYEFINKHIYKLLEYINKNGTLIIYLDNIFHEKTLFLLQNICSQFKKSYQWTVNII